MVEEITIRKIPVKDIQFDETNPNELTDEQMGALKETMEKFGYLAPVVLNKNLEVVDGEHRVRIYQELGKKNIQAYVLDIDNIDKKILRQLMNKLKGKHDKSKDADEFKAIFESGRLDEFSELLAQDVEEFQQVLEKKFDIEFERGEEDEIPEPQENTKVKLGDIYQLGRHRILCGDSSGDLREFFQGCTIDLMVTDPPYGVDYGEKNKFLNKYDRGTRIDADITNDNLEVYDDFFKGFLEKIPFSDYNSYYMFMGYTKMREVLTSLNDLGYYNAAILIWVKNQFVVGRSDFNPQHEQILYGWKNHHKFHGDHTNSSVFFEDKPRENKLHPTMKPIPLVVRLIKLGSKKGMKVYEPFLGSGTTLIACEETDRICYGVEIEPKYIDVVIKRWENYTGKKAQKV